MLIVISMVAVLIMGTLVLGVLAHRHPQTLAGWTMALARRLAGLRTHWTSVDGWRIAYLEGGRGEPLLLLHGIGADKDNFLLVARELRRHYRVIVPDLPGFGDSERRPDADYRAVTQVGRLRALCRTLGIERFHIGGNSMGGLIAGVYAARHPEEVLSLWLLAPAGVKAARASPLMQAINRGEPLPIFARTVAELRALFAFVMQKPPRLPGYIMRALAQRQAAAYLLNQRIVATLVEGPWLDEIFADGIDIPALIVWGDHDRALDCSGAEVLRRLMPRAQVALLPGIGHVPMMELPRQVVRDYLRFRREISAQQGNTLLA